jgi:hypothetical protein
MNLGDVMTSEIGAVPPGDTLRKAVFQFFRSE